MKHLAFSFAFLSCIGLVGCGGDSQGDTSGEGEGEGEGESDLVLPQAGDWAVVTTGYTNDDCNAEGFLIPHDTVTFSNVESSSFSITYYLENERIGDGSSTCSHLSDDVFECEEVHHSTAFSASATVSMVAVGTVTMTSETSAAGVVDLVLECTGGGCSQVAGMTNTGSLPCDTTLNWTAMAE